MGDPEGGSGQLRARGDGHLPPHPWWPELRVAMGRAWLGCPQQRPARGLRWWDLPKQLHFVIPKWLVVLLPKHAEVGSLHVDVGGLCKTQQQPGVSKLPSL